MPKKTSDFPPSSWPKQSLCLELEACWKSGLGKINHSIKIFTKMWYYEVPERSHIPPHYWLHKEKQKWEKSPLFWTIISSELPHYIFMAFHDTNVLILLMNKSPWIQKTVQCSTASKWQSQSEFMSCDERILLFALTMLQAPQILTPFTEWPGWFLEDRETCCFTKIHPTCLR